MATEGKSRRATAAVRAKARRVLAETWQSQANLSFFLVLLVLFSFVFPVLGFGRKDIKLYSDATFSLLLISGVAIAWGQRWLMLIAGFVGSACIAVRWMNLLTPSTTLQIWSDAWSVAAILVIAFVLLAQVFRPGRVSHSRIQGAIAVYLMFGAAWAHAYHLAAMLQPGSFNSTANPLSNATDWIYFSFVTLSTLGYGDITPVRPIARTLSIGEALTGQLYLAVLIARLVAMEVISWQESRTSSS
jgi:hypothetical protein